MKSHPKTHLRARDALLLQLLLKLQLLLLLLRLQICHLLLISGRLTSGRLRRAGMEKYRSENE